MNTSATVRYAVAAGLFAIAASFASADVKANWTKHCGRCHAADGSGNTKIGKKQGLKDYTSAADQAKFTDDEALKAIVEGVKGDDGKEKMQGYKEKLSEDEAKELVAYIRTMKK